MTENYERVFEVKVAPERAFRAFIDPRELEQWFTRKFDETETNDGGTATSPGGDVSFELVEARPGEVLRYQQFAGSNDVGIDVTIVFESIETGTRIKVTNAGFGGESILTSRQVQGGLDETYADLVLYLDHAVSFPRHRDLYSDTTIGAVTRDTTAGAVVTEVEPGQLAEQIGIVADDLIVQLGSAPVFRTTDIAFFVRSHMADDEVEIVWIHDCELRRATSRLGRRDMHMFEHVA